MKLENTLEVFGVNKTSVKNTLPGLLLFVLILSACQAGTQGEFSPLAVRAPDCTYGGELQSVEAIDEYTVKFTLCDPDPAFAVKIANPVFSIQDDQHLKNYQGISSMLSQYVNGTGPYLVDDQSNPDHIVLKLNPDYWGPPAKTSRIIISWVDSPQQRFAQLNSGVTDAIDNPDPDDFDLITTNPDLDLHFRPPLNVYYIGFNNTYAPFNDQRVRQGFAQAINRQFIVENLFPKGSEIADEFLPRTILPGYTTNLRWYEINIGDATRALQDANFDFSQNIVLFFEDVMGRYTPSPRPVAEYIKDQLDELGIVLTVQPMTTENFQNAMKSGGVGFFLGSVEAEYPDASSFYNQLFLDPANPLGTLDENIITEINAANRSTDPDIRQQHYDIVNRLIKDQVPIIPVANVNSGVANRVTIENVIVGSFAEDFAGMGSLTDSIIFTQQKKPSSLWPADEEEIDTLRIATLLYDTLVDYSSTTNEILPSLADFWSSNADATEWTFTLRYGVKFTNGAILNANDVVATFNSIWVANEVSHAGRSGDYVVFKRFFGEFLFTE